MSEADTLQLFEQAFSQAVADGASPDDIQTALNRMQRRADQLKIARGELDGDE